MDRFKLQEHLKIGITVLAYDHPEDKIMSHDHKLKSKPKLKTIKDIRDCEYHEEAIEANSNEFCAHCVGIVQFDDENRPECLNYPNLYLITEVLEFLKESDFKI